MTNPKQPGFYGLHVTNLPCRMIDTDTHTAQRMEDLVRQLPYLID